MDSNIDAPDELNCLSVREISSRIAMILRGSLSSIEHGNNIMLRDTARDCYVSVTIRETQTTDEGCNLFLEAGRISTRTVYSKIALKGIEHLYITLDIPHLVAFCYVHSGRYYIFDVNADATFNCTSNIDKRQNEPDPDPEILNKRRAFYHIGIIEPEVEEKPLKETETEEKKDEETEELSQGAREQD